MERIYDDDGFEFERRILLGAVYRQLADIGEVEVTFGRIPNGDREAFVRAWTETAERIHRQADASLAAGSRVSARSAYLRAANYYDHASAMAPGTAHPGRFTTLWEKHRACWDQATELFDPPVDKVQIPYEGTTLEGYLARPPGDPAQPRPTLVLTNGSDGSVCAMWQQGAAAAVDRGWNALIYDGPGQGASLHRQGLHFRPDWEAVLTPVVDWLVAQPGVDVDRLAVLGVSQAGYWVPRAVAFEHRLAAAVADPGVVDVSTSWRAPLPDFLVDLLHKGDRASFDALMAAGLDEEPAKKAELAWRMAPFGLTSYFDAYQAAAAMHLDADTLARITCPLLITDPDHEQFWPGQSARLHEAVGARSTLVRFTTEQGADWHCEPTATALREERVFDWLSQQLA